MSRFLTTLQMERGEGKRWVLSKDLVYDSDLAGKVIIVPAGFETDLDSVPRLPLAYLLFKGACDEAAVVHDWLYSSQQYRRSLADAIFREAMAAMDVPAWRKWPIWVAVRVGGWFRWNQKENDDGTGSGTGSIPS